MLGVVRGRGLAAPSYSIVPAGRWEPATEQGSLDQFVQNHSGLSGTDYHRAAAE